MSEVPPATSFPVDSIGETIQSRRSQERVALQHEVESFFDEFHDPLMRYLKSFRLVEHDAEDVIQEVFLALFRHLVAGGARTNLKGWIFRVAHNLGIRRRHRERRSVASSHSLNPEIERRHIAPDSNPEERLLNDQRRERLLAVVHALPGRDRECLFLRAEGLRYREIAEVLGVSLGTVASTLERCWARLHEADRR